ncbi:MAG: PIN domain-containing protein [Actinomycetota bacterium]|nr:PIN domain-containing protein [Actinomycetota bacterium]
MGLTLVDAGILIAFLDETDVHHRVAKQELVSARQRGDQIAIPASALAESLVFPARKGESSVATVSEFIERLPLLIVELDSEIAIEAAKLRARHGQKLKLPDALVVASAIQRSADVLVTTDQGWPTKSKLGYRGNLVVL